MAGLFLLLLAIGALSVMAQVRVCTVCVCVWVRSACGLLCTAFFDGRADVFFGYCCRGAVDGTPERRQIFLRAPRILGTDLCEDVPRVRFLCALSVTVCACV